MVRWIATGPLDGPSRSVVSVSTAMCLVFGDDPAGQGVARGVAQAVDDEGTASGFPGEVTVVARPGMRSAGGFYPWLETGFIPRPDDRPGPRTYR